MTDLRVLGPNRTYAGWILKSGTHRLRALSLFFLFILFLRDPHQTRQYFSNAPDPVPAADDAAAVTAAACVAATAVPGGGCCGCCY